MDFNIFFVFEKNGLYFFEIFQPYSENFFHVFSSKQHGSLRKNDEQNRKSFLSAANLQSVLELEWHYLQQVHGDNIALVNDNFSTIAGIEGDALITTQTNQPLAINTADCQAVLLFDPVQKVVANVHNGWRGSVQKIISKTVEKMMADFSSQPQDILAGVSPSLGPCCAYFTAPKEELPQFLHQYILPDSHSVDFWQSSKDELLAAGLQESNIELAKLCTKCNSDLFFSYRADKEDHGRMLALITLL